MDREGSMARKARTQPLGVDLHARPGRIPRKANAYRNRGCGRPCDRGCGAPVFFNTVAIGSSAVAADELMDRVLAFNQPDQTPMWGVDD